MPISSTTFNYNVAKIIDTPWNTIINGLNYTKQNLAPLSLKYTLANNYDCGLILKEYAGNSPTTSVPMEDFSWQNAVRDYDDSNKYWMCNTCHRTRSNVQPKYYCAEKYIDENGFEYSNITNAYSNDTLYNSSKIIYQDSSILLILDSSITDKAFSSETRYGRLYRYKKEGNKLVYVSSASTENSFIMPLFIENGYLYYITHGKYNYFYKYELSSGVNIYISSYTSNKNGILTTYPSNVINSTFYVKNMYSNEIYKMVMNDTRTSITSTVMTKSEIDNCYYGTESDSYHGYLKNFCHIYESNNNQYLLSLSLNSYSYTSEVQDKSYLILYQIDGDNLILKQKIRLMGLSFIPKNDWNNLFIGCLSGLKSFTWDSLTCKFIENPSIFTTIQTFGFDIDERLWIMDSAGSVLRYTFNQPVTVDYNFEKQRYYLGTETIESYADVKVLNYMGDNLTSAIKLKAVGNFTFINNQKELEITLTSEGYTRIPVYIKGSGKYEIKI